MPIAGLLLITGLLSQAPTPSLPVSTTGTDVVVASRVASAPQTAGTQGEGSQPQPTERAHQLGLGGSMGIGSRGGGGAFRYFFGDQVGFNVSVGWYRPMTTGGVSQGSTFLVAPSMVYMLTKSRTLADVDVRPYVGGGVNYANGSAPVRTGASSVSSAGGLGMQAFGGVELTFHDAKSIAISAEVAHYTLAVSGLSSGLSQGTNFYLLFHYYLR